jgi:hypothetical protein
MAILRVNQEYGGGARIERVQDNGGGERRSERRDEAPGTVWANA